MEFPIRCFTCNKVIIKYYDDFIEKTKTMKNGEALDELKIKRYCCRNHFISYPRNLDDVKELKNKVTISE